SKRRLSAPLSVRAKDSRCTYSKYLKNSSLRVEIKALAVGVAPFCTYGGNRQTLLSHLECMAGTTGLEPASSAVTESETRNSLEPGVANGHFQRPEEPLVTLIGPLMDPRPLPCKPLPNSEFGLVSALAAVEPRATVREGDYSLKWIATANKMRQIAFLDPAAFTGNNPSVGGVRAIP